MKVSKNTKITFCLIPTHVKIFFMGLGRGGSLGAEGGREQNIFFLLVSPNLSPLPHGTTNASTLRQILTGRRQGCSYSGQWWAEEPRREKKRQDGKLIAGKS